MIAAISYARVVKDPAGSQAGHFVRRTWCMRAAGAMLSIAVAGLAAAGAAGAVVPVAAEG